MGSYDDVCDANNLMKHGKKCIQGVDWKYSSQAFYIDRILRVKKSRDKLLGMERISSGFTEFGINERGKYRQIDAVHIDERMVQATATDDILIKSMRPRLIYDNYASLKQRGTSLCIKRLAVNLQKDFRRYGGNDFYIAVSDLHSYFASINHDELYVQCLWCIDDSKSIYLTMDFVDAFGEVGLGLGSPTYQILAVSYPNDIDHTVKEKLHIKSYGRYNDDFYMTGKDKGYLQYCLDVVEDKYKSKGIEFNKKKTHIIKASKCLKFLKMRVFVSDTGKVVMKPDNERFAREKRRLFKMQEKLNNGEVDFTYVYNQYKSWRGGLEGFNCYHKLQDMDRLFNRLFIDEWREIVDVRERPKPGFCYADFGTKRAAAERRHGNELTIEWD